MTVPSSESRFCLLTTSPRFPRIVVLPLEGSMFFILVAISLAWGLWACWRPKGGFLSDFATLLDRPEFVHGLENTLANRAFLKGEFRGRKVVVLLQNGRGEYSRKLRVSPE